MADDIVKYLRLSRTRFNRHAEAADEIERLREWKELAYQMRNKYWWAMLGKTLSQFDDMHRADWALPHNVALRQQLKRDAQ